MRINLIHINGEYKNLKDFKLEFDGKSFIDVFVGKNGTGKSNFFEAAIEIFKHLDDHEYPITFNYKFYYEIEDKSVQIEWKDGKFIDNKGAESAPPSKELLPDNFLIYYSGHNPTINRFILEFENKYSEEINKKRNSKTFNVSDGRRFLGIGNEYKSLLLSLMLLQGDELKAKQFIFQKLVIKSLGAEIKITFKRPAYAIGNSAYTFDEYDEKNRFWGAEGFAKEFLEKIWSVKKFPYKGTRTEGYISSVEPDEYILYRDLNDFQKVFKEVPPLVMFFQLDVLKAIGMLKDISIDIELITGKALNVNQFSDGQFQSIYIYTITELFKNNNCITLLDEPDSFLHPEWQYAFLKQINEISEKSKASNHVLMTSHSAITLIPHLNDKICFFDFSDKNEVISYSLLKREAINKLSSSLISYSEQDQILSIINTIQLEKKPVLFTEGKTDPLIIKEAWYKIFPGIEIPFIPFYAFGHRYLVQLMKDPEVIKDMKGLPMFGLFDYDKAFNSWNGFSKKDISRDPYTGMIKQLEGNEVYAMMLPVPKDKPIENQVINKDKGETYGEHAVMSIEHLFSHLKDLEALFVEDKSLPSKFKRFQSDKVKFAKEIVPKISNTEFEVFRPLFEFVKSKC